MSIKSDKWIRRMSLENEMIQPFESNQLRHVNDKKIISYGTSSYGYDVRCSTEFKIFTNINHNIVDPKDFDAQSFVEIDGDECIIPPNSFALAASMEYFKMPRRVTGLVTGKSSYCRSGLGTPSTVLEGGWTGNLVMEFANHSNLPIKLYANSGAAQVLFFLGEEPKISYAEGQRKYQGQVGITLAKSK